MYKPQISVILLMIIFGYYTAYSQKEEFHQGFYLNRQLDTIYGQFNFARFNSNIIFFTAAGDREATRLLPEEVTEITAGTDIHIITHSTPIDDRNHHLFLQRVLRGSINLFIGVPPKGQHVFYLNSYKNPALRKIPTVAPDRFLSAYFPECTQEKVRPSYNTPSLQAAIRAYHECLDDGTELEEIKSVLLIPPFRWEFGISGILAREQTTTSGWMSIAAEPTVQPSLGLSTRLAFGQTLVEMGINFSTRKIFVSDSVRVISWTDESTASTGYVSYPAPFDLRYQVFSFPLTITQRLANKQAGEGPFVVAGVAVHLRRQTRSTFLPHSYWLVNRDGQEYYYRQVYSPPTTDPKEFIPLGVSNSLYAGIGFSKKIDANKRIELSLRYAVVSEKLLSSAPMYIDTKRLELVSSYFFSPAAVE